MRELSLGRTIQLNAFLCFACPGRIALLFDYLRSLRLCVAWKTFKNAGGWCEIVCDAATMRRCDGHDGMMGRRGGDGGQCNILVYFLRIVLIGFAELDFAIFCASVEAAEAMSSKLSYSIAVISLKPLSCSRL